MCGINGIVHRNKDFAFDEATVRAMRDMMVHRGPDDSGVFIEPGIALGSRRLAIVDLSPNGHMPMSTADGRYHIVYNGEVYNYRDLRPALEAKGIRFRSNTDTEVLLALYATEGAAMLDRLNGMFAFAIWDRQLRELFIARDRLGIKPLYYAERDGALYFASEEKALFRAGVPAEFDPATWEELLCFRYVAGERTPFKGVRRLLPGHTLTWKDGRIRTDRWWKFDERVQELREIPEPDPERWFRETFDDSIRLRRISDVPVGVLLSGGLDSSSVAASLATQAGSGVASFTVRFDEAGYDEGPLARETAERWKLNFHELKVKDSELLDLLETAAWLNDEPLAHSHNLHLFAISRYAKPRVTVLLSGEGSDETLGGYFRYRPLRHPAALKLAGYVAPWLPLSRMSGRPGKLGRFLAMGSVDDFVLYNTCDVLPEDLRDLGIVPKRDFEYRLEVLERAKKMYPGDRVRQAMYNDQHTSLCSLLDRNDRMTMGASIECRVPFLDYRLVERLASLPSSTILAGPKNKQLLRNAVGSRLPESILQQGKWGFGVPWSAYLRRVQILGQSLDDLPKSEPVVSAPFSRGKLQGLIDSFRAGDNRNAQILTQLLMMSTWHNVNIRGAGSTREAPVPALHDA